MNHLKGFMVFVREQGVVGLAVGLVLGGAVQKLVAALVSDIVSPILGVLLGAAKGLDEMTLKVGPAVFKTGHFASAFIDFAVISAVIYFIVKGLGFDKIDRKK